MGPRGGVGGRLDLHVGSDWAGGKETEDLRRALRDAGAGGVATAHREGIARYGVERITKEPDHNLTARILRCDRPPQLKRPVPGR